VHAVSHGGKIYYSWDTCEVLQDNSGWFEGDIGVSLGTLDPVQDLLDIGGLDVELVAVSHGGLEKDPDGVWEGIKP